MKFTLITIAVAFACSGCTQPDTARRVLEGAGYKDIELQGYGFFSCGKDDAYHDKFSAVGPSGQKLSGTVCSGLFFKNSTIRFE